MTYIILALFGFFLIGIILQRVFKNLCVVCFTVMSTWILGLIVFLVLEDNSFVDPVILGILMGGSAVGGMYYFSLIISENLRVFKFPYLVTMFSLVYLVLEQWLTMSALLVLLALWILFLIVYLFREKNTKLWFKKIIACCRDW